MNCSIDPVELKVEQKTGIRMSFLPKSFGKINRSGAPEAALLLSPDEVLIKNYSKAIIIIVATWSRAAKLAYSALTSALATEIRQGLKVYAVDHDALDPEKAKEIFGILPEGCGETFWVNIPITPGERALALREGLEALESRFESSQFDYIDPLRKSVVRSGTPPTSGSWDAWGSGGAWGDNLWLEPNEAVRKVISLSSVIRSGENWKIKCEMK